MKSKLGPHYKGEDYIVQSETYKSVLLCQQKYFKQNS